MSNKKNFKMRLTVNGEQYRSVKQAFEQLGLPLEKHIRFRGLFNHDGVAVFEHAGKEYVFHKLEPAQSELAL